MAIGIITISPTIKPNQNSVIICYPVGTQERTRTSKVTASKAVRCTYSH